MFVLSRRDIWNLRFLLVLKLFHISPVWISAQLICKLFIYLFFIDVLSKICINKVQMRFATNLNMLFCYRYKNDEEDWGMSTYLSQGHKIPVNVLVWGRVVSIFMLKIMILSRCIRCKQIVENPVCCDTCKETEREMDFTAKWVEEINKLIILIYR